MSLNERHTLLLTQLADEHPNHAAAFARAFGLALFCFVFCSGLVFTVWPIAVLAWRNFDYRIVQPLAHWIEVEPVFGYQLVAIVQICALVALIYLLRRHLLLAYYIAAREAVTVSRGVRARFAKRAPPRAQRHANTDIVAG